MSRKEVLERMGAGVPWDKRLVVEPCFREILEENTSATSIDFHLGSRFLALKRKRNIVHDPLEGPAATEEFFVSLGEQFVLVPGQVVLGATLEWFRLPLDMMALVDGRSIWGRTGLSNATAKMVHPGSTGTITLELANAGEIAVKLKPGVRVGQLGFFCVNPATQESRRTSFSGSLRPVLGRYIRSESEKFLLSLPG